MKKLISIITIIAVILSFTACGNKKTNNEENINQNETEISVGDENQEEEKENENVGITEDEGVKVEDKKDETKPQTLPATKPTAKPENIPNSAPDAKPENVPAVKPEEKPVSKPVPTPQPEAKPEETNQSVGNVLLSEFKKNASGKSAEEIANILVQNSVIKFAGGVVPVTEGFLTGFDNAEIKGFKDGAMFAPMIGTIPFVGYVFELSEGVDASSFISTLKSNANLRWNICTQAEEMVTGSVGNKVFFVMSNKSLEE